MKTCTDTIRGQYNVEGIVADVIDEMLLDGADIDEVKYYVKQAMSQRCEDTEAVQRVIEQDVTNALEDLIS